MTDAIRRRHDAPKTLQAYAGWLRKFRGGMANTPPAEVAGTDAKRFLADLAVRRPVSAATQHQACNALLLRFRQGLTKALGELSETPRAKRRTALPTVLSRPEVERL